MTAFRLPPAGQALGKGLAEIVYARFPGRSDRVVAVCAGLWLITVLQLWAPPRDRLDLTRELARVEVGFRPGDQVAFPPGTEAVLEGGQDREPGGPRGPDRGEGHRAREGSGMLRANWRSVNSPS